MHIKVYATLNILIVVDGLTQSAVQEEWHPTGQFAWRRHGTEWPAREKFHRN